MAKDNELRPSRRPHRLPHYDYASAGAYFVTICTAERACTLAEVRDEAVQLAPLGEIVLAEWLRTPLTQDYVELDAHVIMPNHLHAVVILDGDSGEGDDAREFGVLPARSLSAVINHFKGRVTKRAGGRVWQAGFYEHVIRGPKDLDRVRQYIAENPLRWALDEENPATTS